MKLENVKLKYSNDYDLGEYFRSNYSEVEDLNHENVKELINEYPNNYKLGEVVRHSLNEG